MDEGSYGSYELFIPAGVIGPGNSTVSTVVYGAASTVYTVDTKCVLQNTSSLLLLV